MASRCSEGEMGKVWSLGAGLLRWGSSNTEPARVLSRVAGQGPTSLLSLHLGRSWEGELERRLPKVGRREEEGKALHSPSMVLSHLVTELHLFLAA